VLSIAGNNVLEKSDLQPALKALKDRLMTKNVVCAYSVVVYFVYLSIDSLFCLDNKGGLTYAGRGNCGEAL